MPEEPIKRLVLLVAKLTSNYPQIDASTWLLLPQKRHLMILEDQYQMLKQFYL